VHHAAAVAAAASQRILHGPLKSPIGSIPESSVIGFVFSSATILSVALKAPVFFKPLYNPILLFKANRFPLTFLDFDFSHSSASFI
jgi:hypothetical protein